MATAAKTLDARIINYLKVLNGDENQALLAVAETFAKAHDTERSEEEKADLDELKRLNKVGKLESYTVTETRKHAFKAIKK